jgi:Leu/Phe-tRNA-protein transferase
MSTARKLEIGLTKWLREQIEQRGVEILDGQVTAEHFEKRKAYRQAFKDMLGALPAIVKKVEDAD